MVEFYRRIQVMSKAFWQNLTQPSLAVVDSEDRRRAQLLASMLIILMPSAFVAIILQAMFVIKSIPVLVIGLLGIGVAVIAYSLSRIRYYAWGALLSVLGVTVSCFVVVIITGSATPLIFLTFSSLIGTLILPIRSAMVVLAINLIIAVGLSLLMPGWSLRDTSDEILFILLMSIAIFGLVVLRRQNVDQIRQQADALVKHEKQASSLDLEQEKMRIMQEFLQNVSHDFRTPLSVINTSTYLLNRADDNADARERHIASIEEQTARISRLLDSMLMMTMLDQKSDYEMRPVNVQSLLQDLVNRFGDLAQTKHQYLRLDVQPDLPCVLADAEWLALALRNTLENALHYTPVGGTVTIRAVDDNTTLTIDVVDTGIGIAEADLDHVFDRLYRTDKARNSHTGGVGLGLSIARKIIEAHGGQMTAFSRVGEGSTFRIIWPLVRQPV